MFKILAHLQIGIVYCVIHTLRLSAKQRHGDDLRQIIGVNMIGIHVIFNYQRRRALLQPIQRQPIGRINPRHAQNRELASIAQRPATQHALGIHAPLRTSVDRRDWPGLVKENPLAIAINPCGADINDRCLSG